MRPLTPTQYDVKERKEAMRQWALRCAYDERDIAWINHLYPPSDKETLESDNTDDHA